ncbi:hypothetical protein DCO58_09570 [Helicobacter saguini]|uniref:Epoxyqueuosine reductase QueH n=1 Tax=Helicobacter saguini TaxID=1548018 RepID=A0A347W5I3_9HELI|nr:epoxyqueuosine reductase QueH [Helicobacter saguini]MWV61435.1 hypothetical protein [Helicobacter saguini]MWV67895.1 hypothetical protein [Helicobacter saguini]MWV70637.1 hypothetical protein [Helicobacter saguini]MWV72541.1 hypothetical protein [Helicobacter saguini]TLD94721.1 epoxyqueuosine reductase QueH [Helicobacter saguini]
MLVHICCSVDSHYFLQELQKAYPHEKLKGFFYNPNIHPKAEHDLRLSDVKRSCEMLNIPLIVGKYDDCAWSESVKGLENEPEKGARCNVCFDVRLIESAKVALEQKEKNFTTTLLSSPMKEQEILYAQGEKIASDYGLNFIKINVRANGGVNRQNELAKKDNLYRQNYCGCKFALTKQREKQGKIPLEMLSSVSGQVMPASSEQRLSTFAKRDKIENEGGGYILKTQKSLVWRLLSGKIEHQREVIPSYIVARSGGKKRAKSGEILWIKPSLENLFAVFYSQLQDLNLAERLEFLSEKEREFRENSEILIGYSKRDDSVFIDILTLNFLLNTSFLSVKDMLKNPPTYARELELRNALCGVESINPIIVLDSKICHDLILDISMVIQEENVYDVIAQLPFCEYLASKFA